MTNIDFIEKVDRTINEHGMLKKGDSVVIGVSGGADSTALLEALWLLKDRYGISLTVAHINHKIRGEEADRDEDFVRKLAQKKGLPFRLLSTDVIGYANRHKMGVEEAGRLIRYNFFEECANGGKIATAHTLSDNAETVVMHLCRGAGTAGLCGIPPVRGNIIRPLINLTREDVESFCKQRSLEFVTDSTNKSDRYARNFVRLNIIPLFKKLNPEFERAAARCSAISAADGEIAERAARQALENCTPSFDKKQIRQKDRKPDGQARGLLLEGLRALDRPLRMKALKLYLDGIFPGDRVDFDLVSRLCNCVEQGGTVNLKQDLKAECKSGLLTVLPQKIPSAGSFSKKIDLSSGEATVFARGKRIELKSVKKIDLTEINGCQKINNLLSYSLLDRDKISNTVILRTRLSGDKISLKKRGCTKSLKKLWNEKKFSEKERSDFLILECDRRLAFSEPDGPDRNFETDESTQNILSIKIFAEE